MMQIVFHENFKNSDYASNSASIPDRMESIIEVLIKDKQYKIITPEPASYQYISLAHSRDYIEKTTVDIVAVSAGFDSYEKDVGKKLKTFDFYQIGRILNKFTKRMGHNRRFAILEGGDYLPDLGKNVLAFCQGFESSGLKL